METVGYTSSMENGWLLTREELEPIVDELIAFYDQLAMNAMSKILNEVRREKVNKQNGSAVIYLVSIVGAVLLIWLSLSVKWQTSEEVVSGIVYNNSNDKLISGNTSFSIRAAEDSYVSSRNESSYCLPPNSPYIPLVKEAARDKKIKVTVVASKKFQILSPWGCMDNVMVTK